MSKILNKHVLAALLATSMGLGATFAQAEEIIPSEMPSKETTPEVAETPTPETVPDWALSFNLGLFSKYMFRGVELSDGTAVQGGIDLAHSSGFYVGTWASNIDANFAARNHQEVDIYGGYTKTFDNGFGINLLGNYYWYPEGHKLRTGTVSRKIDSFEASIALSYVGFTYTYYNILTNYYGAPDSKNATYNELKYAHALPFGGLNFMTKVGYQYVENVEANQGDFAIGLNRDFAIPIAGKSYEGFNAGAYYTTTFNVEDENFYETTDGRDVNEDTVWFYVKRTW